MSKRKHKNKRKSVAKVAVTSSALEQFNKDLAVIALNNESRDAVSENNSEPAKSGTFLVNNDWEGYLAHIAQLASQRKLVTITMDGQVKPFVPDDQANVVAALNEPYIDQMIKDLKVDSAIQLPVTELPAFFIQGNSLINKSVFSDDQVAMNSRSWHQLPSPRVVEVIKHLQELLPKLKAFKGKIVL